MGSKVWLWFVCWKGLWSWNGCLWLVVLVLCFFGWFDVELCVFFRCGRCSCGCMIVWCLLVFGDVIGGCL